MTRKTIGGALDAGAYAALAQLHRPSDSEQLAEIKIEAERRAGELLTEMAARGERRKQGDKSKTSQRAMLSELGVTPDESSRFQQAAAAPADKFIDLLKKPSPPASSASLCFPELDTRTARDVGG
jgi:hypothetical protein